jgi:F-type H+-transporting ATPase subunit delta
MPNPRLAGRYAKSLIDLVVEKDQLESVYNDMLYINSLIHASPELVGVLKSPVIRGDKKDKILAALTKDKIGIIPVSFMRLLVKKGREAYLPEIVSAFINHRGGVE